MKDVRRFAVPQRRPRTGCIPAGYEMLLRAAGGSGVNFGTFQDDFDLEAKGVGSNNFASVAAAVTSAYPSVRFEMRSFSSGAEKADAIDALIDRGQLVLASLTLEPRGRWHIMPVLERQTDEYRLLHDASAHGTLIIWQISRAELIRRHDEWPGGNDIAYLAPFGRTAA